MVTLEELVPKDHLLRQIDATVDFEFIRAKVAHLYCADNGRPALDPVVMFKLLFIGYLFGVRSERQLMREVQVNVAYRWFARFRLTDKVPDASTFSQNRRRRFTDTTVYQEIFDEIVRQAIKRGLVDGRVLYTDSTHLKANANKGKFDVVKLEQTPAAYTEALNAAVDADRAAHGGAQRALVLLHARIREVEQLVHARLDRRRRRLPLQHRPEALVDDGAHERRLRREVAVSGGARHAGCVRELGDRWKPALFEHRQRSLQQQLAGLRARFGQRFRCGYGSRHVSCEDDR
ncbi:transposase [Burkholderia pseudomallei]|nr:transposase [Burkholderia pseudomallei]